MLISAHTRCFTSVLIYLVFLCNELVCQGDEELNKNEMSQYKRKMDLYRFQGGLGKRQEEQPIPEDQFEKRKIDYARFLGSLGKRSDLNDDFSGIEKRSKYDRFMFSPTLGKRFVIDDDNLAAEKRRLDRYSYFGGLGKRARGMDRFSYFGSLGKRGVNRLPYSDDLSKRRIDRYSYFGALGKRSQSGAERYYYIDNADKSSMYNDLMPARKIRSWYWTNRGTKRLPVSIRGVDKYSLFGSLGKRSADQNRLIGLYSSLES